MDGSNQEVSNQRINAANSGSEIDGLILAARAVHGRAHVSPEEVMSMAIRSEDMARRYGPKR